jgi:hypothetical protein
MIFDEALDALDPRWGDVERFERARIEGLEISAASARSSFGAACAGRVSFTKSGSSPSTAPGRKLAIRLLSGKRGSQRQP